MDDLIGVLIFIVIVIISLLKKLKEMQDRNAQKERPHTRAEDLPEATRRMLYGTPNIPKQPHTSPQMREQQRRENHAREVEQQTAQDRRAEPVERPFVVKEQRSPVTGLPMNQGAPVRPVRPVADPLTTLREELKRRAQQMNPQPVHRAPQRSRRPQPAARPVPPSPPRQQPQRAHAVQRKAAAHPPTPQRPPTPHVAPPGSGLFASPEDVRRGIIMSEILGPPKALRY